MSIQVDTIRRLFGNGPADCALDGREYKRGVNPKNPGQFSSGGGASSGANAAPKKEPKPKKPSSAALVGP